MKVNYHLKRVLPIFRPLLFFFAMLLCSSIASADELKVKSITSDPYDIDGAFYSRKDLNGNPCALLKIVLPKDVSNVIFEGSTIDIQNDGVEVYVYLTQGSKHLKIKSAGFEPLEIYFPDYGISALKGNQTYLIIIKKIRKRLLKDVRDISWIAGLNSGTICGDYIGVYTELKFGNPHGFGLEFGCSPGRNNYSLNWTFGVKGYTKGWFVSGHYGTTLPIYGKALTGSISSDGTIIKDGTRDYGRYGFDLLLGFDKSFNWFHFEVGAGVIIPVKETKLLPAWTIGVGIDFLKLIK